MTKTPIGSAALVLTAALALPGCFTTSARMHGLAHDLDRALPGTELEHEFGLTLGRISLGLTKGIARWALDEDDEDPENPLRLLRGLRKVEIATYRAVGHGGTAFPARLERSFERSGWETLARFRDGDDHGWVLCRIDGHRLRNVLVLSFEHDELTMVRLGGRLDEVISAALAYSREEILDEHEPVDRPSTSG